jgi:hypothetical protein
MSKKPWKSKTIIANALVAILAFFPSVQASVSPEHIAQGLVVLNVILRLVTKERIGLE